jgi:hypothetical protein
MTRSVADLPFISTGEWVQHDEQATRWIPRLVMVEVSSLSADVRFQNESTE